MPTVSANYLALLKAYPDYGGTPTSEVPPFTYAVPGDGRLQELRQTYALDTIAGAGRETDRIINLMRWVHRTIRHGGDTVNPHPRNALNILAVCEKEGRGVNCRMLATVLNEIYLAMGFKSRHITCLPHDKQDTECHVINSVFAETMDRWLYMDPTFEAYFLDDAGTILSIRAVRERLILGEPLSPTAAINWNGAPYDQSKYVGYMCKNLFRFSTPLSSEFGYESQEGPKSWVALNPLGYDQDCSEEKDPSGSYVERYYIHSADLFWQSPYQRKNVA